MRLNRASLWTSLGCGLLLLSPRLNGVVQATPPLVASVRDFGATGQKADNAKDSIQRAVDACAKAGGGTVFFPPGDYSSGTVHLRSHVRLYLESGATLYSIKEKSAFDQEALIYADGADNITIEGRGTIDGQAAYEWRLNDWEDDYIRPNLEQMQAAGKPPLRSFPKKDQFGKLFLLLRCRDVRIAGLSLLNSPSWTIHPYACERLVIDGVFIRTSVREGVWADGIDPDGCKDVRISNCTIETGDDAIVFYSMNWFGPALPCQDITVTNCRLTSSSSAIKFCDGNMNAIRRVTIDNCIITGSNRGIAFMDFDGGLVSDVVLSNLSIECVRHDWFWWGDGDPLHFNVKRRSQITKSIKPDAEPPPGKIRRILISNVSARGQGSSLCSGHPESWLEDITIENLRLDLSADPQAPYQTATHALKFQYVKNLRLRNLEVHWGEPLASNSTSPLVLDDVKGLDLDGFSGRQATAAMTNAAVVMNRIDNGLIRNCRAQQGTQCFLHFGSGCTDLVLTGNDVRDAKKFWMSDQSVNDGTIREQCNILRAD
jgi:hypothetical protein